MTGGERPYEATCGKPLEAYTCINTSNTVQGVAYGFDEPEFCQNTNQSSNYHLCPLYKANDADLDNDIREVAAREVLWN